ASLAATAVLDASLGGLLRRLDRQRDRDRRPLTGTALDGDVAAVPAHDLLAQRQSEAAAAARARAATEALEDEGQLVRRDPGPGPVVRALDAGRPVAPPDGEHHRRAGRRVAEGVVDQVHEQALQEGGRTAHRDRALGAAAELPALLLRHRLEELLDLVRELVD